MSFLGEEMKNHKPPEVDTKFDALVDYACSWMVRLKYNRGLTVCRLSYDSATVKNGGPPSFAGGSPSLVNLNRQDLR